LPHIRELCDALAAAGFTALGPDLYFGRAARDATEAELLLATLDVRRSRTMLTTAARQLRAHPNVNPERIGAVGFAMGGWLALLTGTNGALDAIVAYYAALGPDERAHISCPVLMHLAELDRWDPPDMPESFEAELDAAGTAVEVRTWQGARHGFANIDMPAYSAEHAEPAWAQTVEFLDRQLRGPTAAR
jgi:carboxymethylenebutenolidase